MNKNWWNSLRVKIIGWSFVPTVIILFTVAWFTLYSYQKVIGDLAIKQDWAVVQSKTQSVFEVLTDLINPTLLDIILNVDVHKEQPLEIRAQNILGQAKNLDIFDGGIFFLDQQGKVVITQPEQPELLGQDWSDSAHFRFMIDHPARGAYHDLKHIESSGKEILCISVSMNNPQGGFVGAAYYCFTIYPPAQNEFYEAYSDAFTKLDLVSNYYMIDGEQHIIFSTDPSEMGKDLSGEDYLQQLLQGQSMSERLRKGDEDVLVSYAKLYPFTNNLCRWILVKEQSWNAVMQPSLPYRQLLVVLLVLGVILPVLVTSYGVRHITYPIQKLIRASEQVTAGEFKQRIEVKTGDEIESLADQFNRMSAELDESYSSLEKKVADRTHELAILNSIISVANHSLNIQEILEDVLSNMVEQMGFAIGLAFKLEAYPNPPILITQRGIEPTTAMELMHRYARASQGTAAVFPEEVTVFGLDVFQDDQLKNQLSQFDLQGIVYIPLSTKGRQLGFFIFGKHEPGQLLPEEHSLLKSIGKQVGVAMENARLYEQAEQTAKTAERHRLARELHDAVTQTLFSANLIADVIPKIWKRSPEEGLQNLEELRQLTRGALAEMRTMLLEMRPESLERVDIKSLLTQLADAFVGRARVPVALDVQGSCELPQAVKLVFYRVAQEALNNIAKHSGARQVAVHVACQPDHVGLLIEDDGLGFDPAAITPEHLGMVIMHERAISIGASLRIDSQIGIGTRVTLDWKPVVKDGPYE
ncbi:MAG: histidine kinase [Anaerolineales bacterium]|jgi:nitrate/nitrite-specific signal transduction histidine kinase|nr:histidine kinase [Anaerolineales bacterium]